jgi:hypothetical protein
MSDKQPNSTHLAETSRLRADLGIASTRIAALERELARTKDERDLFFTRLVYLLDHLSRLRGLPPVIFGARVGGDAKQEGKGKQRAVES